MSLTTLLILVIFSLLEPGLSNPSCPALKPGMTNVHLVCHTHDDVGWLKTVDQYYYGSEKDITWVGVQYILDSVTSSLLRDPTRKFVYVESAFFYRWWDQQDELTKNDVRGLVDSGQLEFIGGGWSMNDEAATHYNAIIDQMTLGLAKLNETFGPISFPRIAWQIDPFGHSKEQASLFAQMGMDGLFFSRLDHDDKSNRWATKEMEMVWQASNSLGEDGWLFTGVLPNHYSPPSGFCFDLLCNDDPIMDDPTLEDYNKDEMVDKFLLAVEDELTGYTTSNIIMTMGEDFQYMNAEVWYKNLDKLIKYVNERQDSGSLVNVMYSTPSCYLDSLYEAGMVWPTKQDDFFPYSSDPHAYWTGYFTSRPTLKGFIRHSNNFLQAIKQMSALTGIERGPSIETLAKAVGVAQHHDGVTGTAKQHVTDDYSKRLADGISNAQDILNEGFGTLTNFGLQEFEYCPLLNISSCVPTESLDSFVVNVYNPVSRNISYYVRIPISGSFTYEVTDGEGNFLETQTDPIPLEVQNIPGRESSAIYELVFYAEDLPPLDVKQYLVTNTGSALGVKETISPIPLSHDEDTVIKKGKWSLTLDATSVKSIGVRSNNRATEMNVTQSWYYYPGADGDNSLPENRASGAYIFRPNGDPVELTPVVTSTYDGPLSTVINQEWTSWVTQVLRMYKDKDYLEMEWLVGPIPVEDSIGKEIVTRYAWDDMITEQTFYTDANGREMQKRMKDHRDTWEFSSSEPVSQNYYPVTSRLILESTNGNGKAAVLNDRAQGGTSLDDGLMELMVHRRLLHDDAFGVSEALDEQAFGEGLVVRGRHFLVHSDFDTVECDFGCQHRMLGEELLLQPIITFSVPSSFRRNAKGIPKASSLSFALPSNMRILTLEPWGQGQWLLRLENFFEENESSLSGTSSVDIENLFSDWTITDIEEVTLGANQFKKDVTRLTWTVASEDSEGYVQTKSNEPMHEDPLPEYSFSPMQIRSFIVQVVHK